MDKQRVKQTHVADETEDGAKTGSHYAVAHVAGTLKHRKKKKKEKNKRKLNKFERRYSELGPKLKPETKRIDYILMHGTKTSEATMNESKKESRKRKETMRQKFEKALENEGFSIKSVVIEDKVYKKLHCPFKRLCKEAERVKLEMPLKGCEKYPPERMNFITEFIENHLETDNEVDFVSAPFKMSKIDLFENYENPTYFFRPALRSLLTHHILINIDIRDASEKQGKVLQKRDTYTQLKVVEDFFADFCSCIPYFCGGMDEEDEDKILQKIGLPYLLLKEVYEDAFILHEESELSQKKEVPTKRMNNTIFKPQGTTMTLSEVKKTDVTVDGTKREQFDPRKDMDETWTSFWKFQPLWKVRNYFGEKIALYFAWSGMLISTLWIPTLFGLACFFYGLSVSISAGRDTGKDKPDNLTAEQSLKYDLAELMNTVRGSFDNNVTPFFALVICLWGTLFLELWKRHNARLSYEWDVDDYENAEPDRPQFFGTKVKKDPVTQEDNWFYPFKRQILKFCLSASALIFMVSIVFVSLAAVIVYRVILTVDFCPNQTAVECLISTTLVSAILNAVSILILGKIYDWVAIKLTEWENHRTQTQYDDSLIIKLFAFQFANSYASCFYIAFFRGRFDAFGIFGLGPEYSDECDGGNCMSQLSFQVLILMLAKPFPKFLKDIVLPFVKWLWRNRPDCLRSKCCKNQVKDEEKQVDDDSDSVKASKDFLKKECLKPRLEDFTLGEYTEKIIMYGFLMLFAASFPLAPLLAIVTLLIDIRVDAKRLLWLNRRPVAFIAEDIGMWYGILNFVNLMGVISNGFLISFTSSWGQQYDIITRLWICIGFEHIVFALKFLMAYMIPDVPKDVRLAIRREKYQVHKKFEEVKAQKLDYSELIPSAQYNQSPAVLKPVSDKSKENKMGFVEYRVKEDSANYASFDDDDDDDDDNSVGGGHVMDLATVVEEEGAIPSQPTESLYADDMEQDQYDLSMREIDPEGSKLFQRSTSTDRLLPKESKSVENATSRHPKPSFVVGSPKHNTLTEENTEELPPFPPRRVSKYDETDASKAEAEHDSLKVDPYKVVTKKDLVRMKTVGSIDLDETNC